MYHDRYYPFYMAYSTPLFYEGERQQEKEFQMIKTYYPETALKIQEKVEEVSEEYQNVVDKLEFRRVLFRSVETGGVAAASLEDLVQVLLFQEIHRRRCRSCRRRYF